MLPARRTHDPTISFRSQGPAASHRGLVRAMSWVTALPAQLPGDGSGAGSAARLSQRLRLDVSLWAAQGKAAQPVPFTMELESNLAWSGGKSSRKSLHNPHSACQRGGCSSSKSSATRDVAGQERALPAGTLLWDPASPGPAAALPTSLPPHPPGSPVPVRAWSFCCSKCTRAARGARAAPSVLG